MARLGSDNNVRESVVILSSDEEDDPSNQGNRDSGNSADSYPGNAGQVNQYRGIPYEFMRVIKKLRDHLREEKDDRRCNILGLMYRKASKTLTTSESFRNFIKDIMVELEKSKNDRANILLLLTALCQTLAVGEIMWSPGNESKNKSKAAKTNAQSTSSNTTLQKETREQCNAVKALLFNDSPPPPRPPAESTSTSTSTSTIRSKEKENGEKRSRVVTTETKEKEKVEKKTGKKQVINNNKAKHKNNPSKVSTVTEVAEVKRNEKGERKSTRVGRQNSTATSRKKEDSRSPSGSPPIIIPAPKDPSLTDLSSEGISNMVPCSIDISTKDQVIPDNPSPEEMSNVIVLGDFDVDTIDNEEVEDVVVSCSNNTAVGKSSTKLKPQLEKSSTSTNGNDSHKKGKSSLIDVVTELSKEKDSRKKDSSSTREKSKLSVLEVDVDSPSDKPSSIGGTPKSSLLLATKAKSSTPPVKDAKKPTDAKKTKKGEKLSAKHIDKSSTSPILSPTSRRSTFLKAVEKVKKDVLLSGKKPEKEFQEKCQPKSMEKKDPHSTVQQSSMNSKKSSDIEKAKPVKSAKKKKKEETKQTKGSKPSSEDSSDDEVMFISEKPSTKKACTKNTVEASSNVTATNQVHTRNIPNPQLHSPKAPWQQDSSAGVSKTAGQSLLDMCYVYELQIGGGIVPSPLVNNALQPNLQTSALSSRETSRYLESGPQGTISVVTPSKAYTTCVNSRGRAEVGLPPTGSSNYTSEVVTMVDGSIMSIERNTTNSSLEKKRSYPSEKGNSSDVQVIPDDDVCEMTPLITLESAAFLAGVSGKSPPEKATCNKDKSDISKSSVNTAKECLSKSLNQHTQQQQQQQPQQQQQQQNDITVILDSNSSNEGSDNEETMKDKAHKNIKDNKKGSGKSTKDVNVTAPVVDDNVTSNSMLHEKEVASIQDCDTADKTAAISAEGKDESEGDSSEDEVTVVSDPVTPDENSSKDSTISTGGKDESAGDSSEDEETIVSDTVTSDENSSKEKSQTSSKECGTTTDDDDAKVDTQDESSGDEITITSDAGGNCDDKHSEGNVSSPESSEEKNTSDGVTDSMDVATERKSASEAGSSGDDEVTVVSDSDETNGKSSVPDACNQEEVDVSEKKKKKISECKEGSTKDVNDERSSKVTGIGDTSCFFNTEEHDNNEPGSAVPKSNVLEESLTQNQTVNGKVGLNSVTADNIKGSAGQTTKSSGKKSIQDIANALKQQMEKKREAHDSFAITSTVSSTTTTTTPPVSSIETPSARLHLFCSNKFKRLLSSHNTQGTTPPPANQKPGEVILIGDDSDEEETETESNKTEEDSGKDHPVASKSSAPKNEQTVTKNKPIATSTNQSPVVSKPPILTQPKNKQTLTKNKPIATSSNQSPVVSKPPIPILTQPKNKQTITNKKTNNHSPVVSKPSVSSTKSPVSSNKKVVPCQKSSGDKKVSASTVAKPTYVSNILNDRTSGTAKLSSSRILGKSGAEQVKQSPADSSKTTVTDSNDDNDFTTTSPSSPKGEPVTQKLSKKQKIKKLEILLERLERKINRLASQELGYRDMASDGSAYLQESRLKERFLYHWRIYCKLIGEDADLVVSSRKKVKVTGSPFQELNAAVEKYVNKSDIFPNLFEVKNCCTQANNKYNLDLKENDLHNCAVDIFSEVGRKLQKRREKDFRNTSGNVLTDEVKIENDPARRDMDLKLKLKQNRKIAKQRTDNVFKDFVRQQYEQTTGDTDKSSGSESPPPVRDKEPPLTCSDSDTQTSANGMENSDQEDSDNDVPLEQIRKEEAKRRLSSKDTEKPVAKKKRVDKTVISLTLSSSQEIQETSSGNNKIDYQVTIGSSKPTVIKSINNQSRSKSPASSSHQVAQGHQTKQLEKHARKPSQQPKTKSLKLIKPPSKRQLSTDISTDTPSTVKPKDKIQKLSSKVSSETTSTKKQKRISLANDNVAGNYAGFESSESSTIKETSVRKVYDKPFASKKIRPTLLPSKPVLGGGAQKEILVPAEYIPLSVFSNVNGDNKAKDSNASKRKGSLSKSRQERETIILDDD